MSNINWSFLSQDIWTSIIEFLEPKEWPKLESVSKGFQTALIENMWKTLCNSYLEKASPFKSQASLSEETWKKRFKLIGNWMKPAAEVTEYTPSCGYRYGLYDFSLLEDQTPIEIRHQQALTYLVRNCRTDTYKIIDLNDQGCNLILGSAIDEKKWVVLDSSGKILCFDNQTGACLKIYSPSFNFTLNRGKINCCGQEIVTAFDSEVNLWNLDSDRPLASIDLSNTGVNIITSLILTPHFIICTGYTGIHNIVNKTIAIQKSTRTITELDLGPSSCYDMTSSGPYLAIQKTSGEIEVFKDEKNELNEGRLTSIHTLYISQIEKKSMGFYKNWLLVRDQEELQLVDVKKRRTLSKIKVNENARFVTNGAQLFIQIESFKEEKSYIVRHNSYILYNFEQAVQQLNVAKRVSRVNFGSLCCQIL